MGPLLEHGVRIKASKFGNAKAVSRLRKLLQSWIVCVKAFNDSQREPGQIASDVACNYYEQPQVGLLAGASWKAGYASLQDYDANRGGNYRCKVDLYICANETQFRCEAKVLWVDATRKAHTRWKNSIQKKLTHALEQLAGLNSDSTIDIAAIFVCPKASWIAREKEAETIDRINTSCSEALEYCRKSFDAVAWVFPKKDRLFWDFNTTNKESSGRVKRYYPGCIVAIKTSMKD